MGQDTERRDGLRSRAGRHRFLRAARGGPWISARERCRSRLGAIDALGARRETAGRLGTALSSFSRCFERGPRFDEVTRSEAFGEGSVDAAKFLDGRSTLFRPTIQLDEAQCGPKLEGFRALLSRDVEARRDGSLGLGRIPVLAELPP